MKEEFSTSPEQHLLDNLCCLQSYREISGHETEPAVIGEEMFPSCSVFIDKLTNDRIVITSLPDDQKDFEGAAVWISNPEIGVEIRTKQWQASPKDVIFWIDKALSVRYFNLDTDTKVLFSAQDLAERLDVPRIYPKPLSEVDPREIPTELEFITTPQTNTYTLVSRIFDQDIEQKSELVFNYSESEFIAKRSGIISYNLGEPTTFDLKITEESASRGLFNGDEFDRVFNLNIKLGEQLLLAVTPWGKEEIEIKTNKIILRAVREGMIIYDYSNGSQTGYIPSKLTKRFVDSILHYATESQLDA